MKIEISDRKLKKIINDEKKLIQKYGPVNSRRIVQRFNELASISNFGSLVKYKIGRCHSLTGDLKGKYALDLEHPLRMIIEQISDNNQDLQNVVAVRIVKIGDYHG